MPIIEEGGGRLNAYAKEPRMEVVNQGTMKSTSSRIILLVGALLVSGLIAITLTIS